MIESLPCRFLGPGTLVNGVPSYAGYEAVTFIYNGWRVSPMRELTIQLESQS